MKLATLQALAEARAAKRPIVLATDLHTGEQRLLDPAAVLSAEEAEQVARVLRTDRCELTDERWFVQPHNPPLRMLIVGAVHIAQLLVPMAQLAGYAVQLIDPRTAFASEARFPGVPLDHRWPDEAMAELAPDARTAIVALTHDPKIDDPALAFAVGSDAFYVGALGSRRTHAARLDRLREGGLDEAQLARIHGPIGLRLGGRSPAEIAISIMAQITQVLRQAG